MLEKEFKGWYFQTLSSQSIHSCLFECPAGFGKSFIHGNNFPATSLFKLIKIDF